jgi:hypothetical protein
MELNCPRSGAGFLTIDAPFAATTAARLSTFVPATTTITSVNGLSAAIAAESSVSPLGEAEPGAEGGQGSNALSLPMRLDAPAERITPQILGFALMWRR